jgi:hypothetical protein
MSGVRRENVVGSESLRMLSPIRSREVNSRFSARLRNTVQSSSAVSLGRVSGVSPAEMALLSSVPFSADRSSISARRYEQQRLSTGAARTGPRKKQGALRGGFSERRAARETYTPSAGSPYLKRSQSSSKVRSTVAKPEVVVPDMLRSRISYALRIYSMQTGVQNNCLNIRVKNNQHGSVDW